MTASWHALLPAIGVLSLSGKDAAKLLQGQATCDILGLPPISQDNEAEGQSGLVASFYAIRIPDPDSPRFLVLADAAKAAGISRFLESHGLGRAGASRWALEDVRAGIPALTAATVDEFVPQMLNLDLLGGISFNKGCYTGQEIVARTHYLGQLKRRMFRLAGSGYPPPQPGEAVLRDGEEAQAQAAGMVVGCADTPEGGFELLAVLNRAAAEQAGIPLKTDGGLALSLSTLPYPLPEA